MIYFIQNESNLTIKIGYSANVKSRLKSLRTASPHRLRLLGTIPGERIDEVRIHQKLGRHRLAGEWFEPHEDVVAEVTRFLVDRGGAKPWIKMLSEGRAS